MNTKYLLLLGIFLLSINVVLSVSSENNKYKIECTPDTATIQSNGFTQTCYYTNKQGGPVQVEVLYCLNTKLEKGSISYDENIINETGGVLGLFKNREVIDKVKQDIVFESNVYYEDVVKQKVKVDKKGKNVKDKNGLDTYESYIVKEKKVSDSSNYKRLNASLYKPDCYSGGVLNLESDEKRLVIYNYLPANLDEVKWDTYLLVNGKVVFGLDPQFSAEIYEIGTNRSEYYYWINGTVLNVDILNYTPSMSVKFSNISNFENRTNNTVLMSKVIVLHNFISNVRVNSSFTGNASLNLSLDNGTTYLYLTSTNLSNKNTIYNLSSLTENNYLLKYFINLNRYIDSNLVINSTNMLYLYYTNVTNTPNITDWRSNGVSKAMLNLGLDLNEASFVTDYSTNSHIVRVGI